MEKESKALETVWRTPDELWEQLEPVIRMKDPPNRKGRKRVAPRLVLDTLIHRLRSGCQWNHLPDDLADDSSAHRTLQRWQERGVFDAIWALLVESCAAPNGHPGGVDWEWQAADGALGKSRFGGIKSGRIPPTGVKLA
jgi:transposase